MKAVGLVEPFLNVPLHVMLRTSAEIGQWARTRGRVGFINNVGLAFYDVGFVSLFQDADAGIQSYRPSNRAKRHFPHTPFTADLRHFYLAHRQR